MRRTSLLLSFIFFSACGDGGGRGNGAAARFFLPTEDAKPNVVNPTIQIGADGRIHLLYAAYAGGDAYYATCEGACDAARDFSLVRLTTEGTVSNAMLTLDAGGAPHVLMSTYQHVYYARCVGDCGDTSGWTVSMILDGTVDLEVTGQAFALTPDGRPRFVMHSYRAFPSGGPTPETYYVGCDASCDDPASWTVSRIAEQIWQEATLAFTPDGDPRVAAVVSDDGTHFGAYAECDGDCTTPEAWTGVALAAAYEDRWLSEMDPAIDMALTSSGDVRIVLLGESEGGIPNVTWFECDADCTATNAWRGLEMVASDALGGGLDLTLDDRDRPYFVYTETANIRLAACDDASGCTEPSSPWQITPVELSSDMVADEVIPYEGCTIAAWFLRHPSLALGDDGMPRVVYRAEDISGGAEPNGPEPDCVAGADMTLGRYTRLDSLTGR